MRLGAPQCGALSFCLQPYRRDGVCNAKPLAQPQLPAQGFTGIPKKHMWTVGTPQCAVFRAEGWGKVGMERITSARKSLLGEKLTDSTGAGQRKVHVDRINPDAELLTAFPDGSIQVVLQRSAGYGTVCDGAWLRQLRKIVINED